MTNLGTTLAAIALAASTGKRAGMRRVMPAVTIPATPKVGRNQPCPCGSGKKYKKCCLP